MAKKGNRVQVKLKSSKSGHQYMTTKNKIKNPDRMEIKKYDPIVRQHVMYKETR